MSERPDWEALYRGARVQSESVLHAIEEVAPYPPIEGMHPSLMYLSRMANSMRNYFTADDEQIGG